MIRVPLFPDGFAVIDREMSEKVGPYKYRWRLLKKKSGTCYAYRKSNGNRIFMHHSVLKRKAGYMIDHRDCDGLNNRRSNLRYCTASQNSMNQKKRSGCTSKFKGVYFDKRKNKWVAGIQNTDGKWAYLGQFEKETDAALAYNKAAKKLFRKFAYLNQGISTGDCHTPAGYQGSKD